MKKVIMQLLFILMFFPDLFASDQVKFKKIVHKTFKIDMSPYTTAFNPSLCKVGNEYLLTFRYQPAPTTLPWVSYVGIMRLNEAFEPISAPELLDLRQYGSPIPSQSEDARIFTYNGGLYIIYNDNIDLMNPSENARREMFITQIFYENNKFSVSAPIKITHSENFATHLWEKNWTPFVYEDSLLMYYSFGPTQVLNVNWESEVCKPLYKSSPSIKWPWGRLRGGTPAELVDGVYLGFFHSAKKMTSKFSSDEPRWHYFMGAFTFTPEPPFEINAVSSYPITGSDFYIDSDIPKKVIYPGGFVVSGENIYVSYGKDDAEVWIAVMNKRKLMNSLRPIR